MNTHTISVRETGLIKEIKKSIVKIDGLSDCMVGQIVHFEDGTKGFVMGFNEREVLLLLLGNSEKIKAGDNVYSEGKIFRIPVGSGFIGRVITSLCESLDGKGPAERHAGNNEDYPVFREAPSVLERVPVEEILETGIRVIDSCIPIGKGQRELIIGDRMTGKTSIAVDTILNQKGKDVICIYCCVGRDYGSLEKVLSIFKEKGALDYTIIVSALGSSPIGEQYLAPYSAATLGEYFMHSGKDVFVVFDDLTKHAWAYRELSLLLERSPGREAYPGDIFYLHAQLMERAGKLSPEEGGGSMTFFPIVDTLEGDIAGFIPTNLISMTDGQIYLNSGLFAEGFKPAVDIGLSVSRIGNRVQSKFMRKMTKDLGLKYIQYRELVKTTRLRAGLSEDVQNRLRRGEKIERVFVQDKNCPSPIAEQALLFYLLDKKILDFLTDDRIEYFKKNIFPFFKKNYPDLSEKFKNEEGPAPDDEKKLRAAVVKFLKENKI